MAGESDDLDKLFESVADGESVDWDALERDAPDEESRAVIRQLRLIAEVAEVHRSQVDEVPTPDGAMTAPAVLAGTDWQPPPRVPHEGTPTPPDAGAFGQTWGHLLLVRKIGEGSFGEVYQAHDTWLDHPVALKLLKREAEDRLPPSQLLHEARKLARVRHVNVVTVHGADRHNGRVGFWMDFVDGETLAARVQRGRLSSGEATSIGQEVCRALAAVHQARLIHRDVKAQNVMRAHDGGRIILMDFGAGELLGDSLPSRAQGTPLYLAPEVLNGHDATIQSDIYAMGVLLYHLVTNRYPVEGASLAEIREAHARGRRRRLRDERPDLADSFIAIVERALDPDPGRRYASAGEMEAKLAGEPPTRPEQFSIPQPPPAPSPPSMVRRVVGAGLVTIALTAGLGFIASRGFEVLLRVDRDFSVSFAQMFTVGLQALLPFVVMWMVGAAVIGALAGGVLLLGKPLAGVRSRLAARSETWDPTTTAAAIVVVSVAWLVVNQLLFTNYFTPLYELASSSGIAADVTVLGSANRGVHRTHYFVSAYSSMLLGIIVWRWFPQLEKRSSVAAAIRLWKWGAVAVAFLFLAWAVVPRRLVWERFPVVEFDNRTGLVIGSAGNELLVYTPDEPGRPSRRVRSDAPGLRRTGETRFLFDPGTAK
jgi:tRNA A-37 threonylcarbamoyl transferase component Bud32